MAIIQTYQDMAGKWRSLADTGTEVIMLKFDHSPVDAEANNEIIRYNKNKAEEEARRIEDQINSIETQIASLETQIG